MAKKSTRTFSTSSASIWLWLGLALLVLLADQFTKIWIIGTYQLGDSLPLSSFFNLVRVHNNGAAFSFLAQAGGWQRWFFTGLGRVAALLMIWLRRKPSKKWTDALP